MIMKKATSLILVLLSGWVFGQNMVKNGSLENTGSCPILATDLMDISSPWASQLGTPDYFHLSCGFPGSASTTNNALPFDGEGFVGISVFGDSGTAFSREYIRGEFKEPLEANKRYRITYYVKPLNNDLAGISYGIRNIGMHISDSLIDSIPPNNLIDFVKPQILPSDPVLTESYWTAICGVYKAKGGEKFFTIGNFSDDNSTQFSPLTGSQNARYAYYLIDYVEAVSNDLPSLPRDTIICVDSRIDLDLGAPGVNVEWSDGSTDNVLIVTTPGEYSAKISTKGCSYRDTISVRPADCEECMIYIPSAFSPNGDSRNALFEVKASCSEEIVSYRIHIFNRWGKKVFESSSLRISWDGTYDGEAVEQGIYTYVVEYEYPHLNKTQTLSRRGSITLIK